MNALIYTNEYPPYNYGGAGVHVEYLCKELSKLNETHVDVRCFGDQNDARWPLKVMAISKMKSLQSPEEFAQYFKKLPNSD